MSDIINLVTGNPKAKTKSFEGFRGSVYKDSTGKRTVGYGFNLDDQLNAKMIPREVAMGARVMRKDEADQIFDKVYANAQKDAVRYVGKDNFQSFPIEVQNVIVDMAYNLGLTKLNGFKDMKAAAVSKNWKKMADEMIDSKWYSQVGNRSKEHVKTIRSMK